MSEPAVDRGHNVEDCPLCLEPLPPFWDIERRALFICCGKVTCKDCYDSKDEFLHRADAEGSFGREERQLASVCPLCRTKKPTGADSAQKMMEDKFEEGCLPLHLYHQLGMSYLEEAIPYLNGDGGAEVDVERGKDIRMLGAQKGDPECQYSIGNTYAEGEHGLPQSLIEAKRWWLAAAEQGHAIAEYNLAITFEEEGNDAEYLRHLKGSASKGYNDAPHSLGVIYYKGTHGVQQSFEEAIRMLTPAAERGHSLSMGMLGYVMCKPDPDSPLMEPWYNPHFTKGVHWVRRAAETGDESCIKQLRAVEEKFSNACFMCPNRAAPPEKAFLRCSQCRAAWYCSKDCQRQHWKAKDGHKQFCVKWTS